MATRYFFSSVFLPRSRLRQLLSGLFRDLFGLLEIHSRSPVSKSKPVNTSPSKKAVDSSNNRMNEEKGESSEP